MTAEALGGARTHTRTSGVAHLAAQDDVHAMAATRELISFLPSSNREAPPVKLTEDGRDRQDAALDMTVPSDPNAAYDMGGLVRRVLDERDFLEIQPHYAKNILTGFGRMEGHTVGVVANQPQVLPGRHSTALHPLPALARPRPPSPALARPPLGSRACLPLPTPHPCEPRATPR